MDSDEPLVVLHDQSHVAFASVAQAGAVFLDASDAFSQDLQPFEIAARSRSTELDRAQFRRYQAAQVLPWTAHERQELTALVEDVRTKLARFKWLPLPPQVLLIKTSGKEETGKETVAVAYCRGRNAIVITRANFDDPVAHAGLTRLLLHELWHIISRNCTDAFVDRVYKCFGFLRIANGPMAYPEELSQLRFTNPDALHISHYISVRVDDDDGGHALPVAPMVYLRPYDITDAAENPFDNIAVAWGVLRFDAGGAAHWATSMDDDDDDGDENSEDGNGGDNEPAAATVLLPHGQLPGDFWQQISRNTEYTLHVEEICAENFVLCVTGDKAPDDPSRPQAIFEVLDTGTSDDVRK